MPEVARLVWLDEADAGDPALVGAKASRLARARARGLPVLDGIVVPVGVADPIVRRADAVLRSSGNSGAARSAVYNHQPPPLLEALAERSRELGDSLVVRSSSRAEAEGVWAGAFSSYLGMRPQDVIGGVLGCWASIFNPNTLKRGAAMGTVPPEVGMAVLVQPEIQPSFGGIATLGKGGTVTVAGSVGHPAGLVAGWESGHVAVVTRRGEVETDSSPLGARLLRRVADLGRATAEKTACSHIEWMADREGRLYLVQAQPNVDTRLRGTSSRAPDPVSAGEPWISGVAHMMIRFPGRVGERLVWPWAIGLEDLSLAPEGQTRQSVKTLVKKVREGTALLMSQRWGGTDPVADLDRAWSALHGGDYSLMLDLISRGPSVDRRLAAGHLRNLHELGQSLTTAGVIPHPGWMWHLDPDCLERPFRDQPSPMSRVGTTTWDAWVYGVVSTQGETIAAIPAAGGWGVGRLRFIRNADDATRFSPREVIAVSHPIGNLAPLLWNASGLVTSEGSPGAHLFEVAEWLGVPAVCGVDFSQLAGEAPGRSVRQEDLIVAVDGHRGHITMTPSKP